MQKPTGTGSHKEPNLKCVNLTTKSISAFSRPISPLPPFSLTISDSVFLSSATHKVYQTTVAQIKTSKSCAVANTPRLFKLQVCVYTCVSMCMYINPVPKSWPNWSIGGRGHSDVLI